MTDRETATAAERKPEAKAEPKSALRKEGYPAYLQNRELSWLTFNERVLDQGADPSVPLLERWNFVSIFWSNLQEFFMVRVGSLTDLSLAKKEIIDSKSGMTPAEQILAIHDRCHELYPIQERVFEQVRSELAAKGVHHLRPEDLDDEQRAHLLTYFQVNVEPFLSPQIINSRHPFPHLENGALYVVVRLDEEAEAEKPAKGKKKGDKGDKAEKGAKNVGAEGVLMGLIPLPRQAQRVIKLPGDGFRFILLEHVIEMFADQVFSMYTLKHTNVICVTRNADLDANEGADEADEDYREHMKRILKRRGRLAPVRLESEHPLSDTMGKMLLKRLNLKAHQTYVTSVPLDLGYTWGLGSMVSKDLRNKLTPVPFTPQWPASLERGRSIIEQVSEREVLLSYPYESMDAFVQLLREAANDPKVISIKITLYRLASQSHLAEALIHAAENGKQVTALFELRARFDESNNIEWSQRFEEAGCNVIYGFRDFKVHSKICCITRQTDDGLQYITQLGTGNYNEKTAKLYTDFSFITTDEAFGRDATDFFRNMALENVSDDYDILWVAPLQIKPYIIAGIENQIRLAQAGEPCGLVFKTNSITDRGIIDKLAEASQAGVPITLLVRGISCIVPGVEGLTENVRVVSIVGRLLEHSRIYGFGPHDSMRLYLSSADLMTRNMEKRVEIAWPVLNDGLRRKIVDYVDTCLADTAKLRELLPNGDYTPLRAFAKEGEEPFDSQEHLIRQAQIDRAAAVRLEAERASNKRGGQMGREEAAAALQAKIAEGAAAAEVQAKIDKGDAAQAAAQAVGDAAQAVRPADAAQAAGKPEPKLTIKTAPPAPSGNRKGGIGGLISSLLGGRKGRK